MFTKCLLLILLLFPLLQTLKLQPIQTLNSSNFASVVGCNITTFLQKGCNDSKIWMFLMTIPNCQYCEQADILFYNSFIEYQQVFQSEELKNKEEYEENLNFANIDWYEFVYIFSEKSAELCAEFNPPHYPYEVIIENNGDVCAYTGEPLPNKVMEYFRQRKQGNKYEKCKNLGKMNIVNKILGYIEPITNMLNYNTVMFVIAFVIGPFLFGFVFSRSKKNKPENAQAVEGQKTQ